MGQATTRPRIYLAGPTVFLPDPALEFAEMKSLCADLGLAGVSPLDGQLAIAAVPSDATTRAIVEADIGLMEAVDGALVCLDGFRRAPDMDPGTAFEIGWLAARGKPMCGWTRETGDYPAKVATYFEQVFGERLTAAAVAGAATGGLRDPDGVLVHSAGLVQNAMVHIGIERGGGIVVRDSDWRAAFAAAAAALAARLGPRG